MALLVHIHPRLPAMRRVSRGGKYAGPCPFCGEGVDRFIVWTTANPQGVDWRYWCNVCHRSGLVQRDFADYPLITIIPAQQTQPRAIPQPDPAQIAVYRTLYAEVAIWARHWFLEAANPAPRVYVQQRGLNDAAAGRAFLGYALHDSTALIDHLRATVPDLIDHVIPAGIGALDDSGQLVTHWNLRGVLVFPTMAQGAMVDLRTRRIGPGHKARSLAGSPEARGAIYPIGWDALGTAETVLLTESGEFKALVPLAAYEAGELAYPTLGHPGLNHFQPAWGAWLRARGVRTVVLAYDSQPRLASQGVIRLAPEEVAVLRHGWRLAHDGLLVRVLRLPLAPGAAKADLDDFLLTHGPAHLQALIDRAPLLSDYHRSLPRALLAHEQLPAPISYPTRRSRPRRVSPPPGAAIPPPVLARDTVRQQIAEQVYAHAMGGRGLLVLAHQPGAGKGYATSRALRQFQHDHPDPGFVVWTALRAEQVHDQPAEPDALTLTALYGRNSTNCQHLPAAQILSAKGYDVRAALCQRRCGFVARCAYLRQFAQDGDFFAATPLLQATHWWEQAGVVVLDEFDPARLTRTVRLNSTDLAAMQRTTTCPYATAILRWLALVLGTTLDRSVSGLLLYGELAMIATREQLDLWETVRLAAANLPDPQTQSALPGVPTTGLDLHDYEALPPGWLDRLIRVLAREASKFAAYQPFTSRLEASDGRLVLALRIEHLIDQLARPAQPKIILDASANPVLLRALFPTLPLKFVQPQIAGAPRVVQVIGQDWAKSGLHGAYQAARRERWYDAVAAHIRPNRPTLVVCCLECADELRAALVTRGHPQVCVGHYGALRGSNRFCGYDVILAQVFHPNLEQLVHEGRALFADHATPLDERMVIAERQITDRSGACWQVAVPTFADPRLAALLEARREAELVQCALRGRPLDHPETQITLLCSLPLPGLAPTIIVEAPASAESNQGRAAATRATLLAAAQQLLDQGQRLLDVASVARAAGVSVTSVRQHWEALAARLHLRQCQQRRVRPMPRGGQRSYLRAILWRRGRYAPLRRNQPIADILTVQAAPPGRGTMIDQAGSHDLTTRAMHHSAAAERLSRRTLQVRCSHKRHLHQRRRTPEKVYCRGPPGANRFEPRSTRSTPRTPAP